MSVKVTLKVSTPLEFQEFVQVIQSHGGIIAWGEQWLTVEIESPTQFAAGKAFAELLNELEQFPGVDTKNAEITETNPRAAELREYDDTFE